MSKGQLQMGLILLVQMATAELDSGLRLSQTAAQLYLAPGTQGVAHMKGEASWTMTPIRAGKAAEWDVCWQHQPVLGKKSPARVVAPHIFVIPAAALPSALLSSSAGGSD